MTDTDKLIKHEVSQVTAV